MKSFNQFTIPFGKYIDPNTLGELELVRYKFSEGDERDELYLVRDIKSNIYYCCYEPDSSIEHDYHQSRARLIMQDFLKNEMGVDYRIELLKPKNEDWLITHYLARVFIP